MMSEFSELRPAIWEDTAHPGELYASVSNSCIKSATAWVDFTGREGAAYVWKPFRW